VPFGVARVARPGTDLTIVSCGSPVQRCLEAAETLQTRGISCEIIDLRSIVPLDVETLVASVAKTGRVLVVDEGFAMCGLGAEIAAVMMEHAFDHLDAPVGRLHTDPTAHPFSLVHEHAVIVTPARIVAAAEAVMAGRPLIPRRLMATVGSDRIHAVKSIPDRMNALTTNAPLQSGRPAVMNGVPLIMPNMDLTITEGTVIGWLKRIGDSVAKGEGVIEVETDKAVVAVEAPSDGRLAEMLVKEGMVVKLGQPLGTIQPIV